MIRLIDGNDESGQRKPSNFSSIPFSKMQSMFWPDRRWIACRSNLIRPGNLVGGDMPTAIAPAIS
jgi:hypothetical protein